MDSWIAVAGVAVALVAVIASTWIAVVALRQSKEATRTAEAALQRSDAESRRDYAVGLIASLDSSRGLLVERGEWGSETHDLFEALAKRPLGASMAHRWLIAATRRLGDISKDDRAIVFDDLREALKFRLSLWTANGGDEFEAPFDHSLFVPPVPEADQKNPWDDIFKASKK